MHLNIIKAGRDTILAACDENILGKTFKEGKFRIEIKESFYKGEVTDCETFVEAAKMATIINLVGKEVIECAIKSRIIDESNIIFIDGIPHAQMVKI